MTVNPFFPATKWLCDRGNCARQAKQIAVFATGTLLLCDKDANENIDGIEIMGGVLFAIDLSAELFPGLHHFPTAKKVQGEHAERPGLSETRCPKCDSAQTYVRMENLDHVCRACHNVWGPGSEVKAVDLPDNVKPMVSPALKAKELEANASQRKELRRRINTAIYCYRVLERPMMTDGEYDELKRQYAALLGLGGEDEGRAAA